MAEPAPTETEPAGEATAYSWYVLGVLVVVYMLNFIDRNVLSILANDIKADLGLTDADLGFLYGTAFGVFYALFGIPLGRLADSWNRTRLMTAGLALWSAMTALSGFARSGTTLSIARIGVGIGEASASPAAYSLLSDWFPRRQRATALAIYSSGLYLGGGLSLLIGGYIVESWNRNFPDGGPLSLAGWQVAFLAVGIPGLLLAGWVSTLREPLRGQSEGFATPPAARPFAGFARELMTVLPPLTLVTSARRGGGALLGNLVALAGIGAVAWALVALTGAVAQWTAVGIGVYAVFSWASELRHRDRPTFALIWGSPAFLCTALGYGLVAYAAYAVAFWAAPFAEAVLGQPKTELGFYIGGGGALGGFLGVIAGGRTADWLRTRLAAGRILVIMFGAAAPVVPLWIAFTTENVALFYFLNFVLSLLTSSALGAAAATTQDLVLPRMRGAATATFFLATTLVGLALGPYVVGQISTATGSLATGVLSLIAAAPISLALLAFAWRLVPEAERTVVDRARAAGEPV